uniref:Kinesin-like protein n=1 Tax=Marsilea vestita TaxID=59764 RepID=A0A142KWD9_MARVE|nr:kinesin OrphIII protein [Marsilea vestita]
MAAKTIEVHPGRTSPLKGTKNDAFVDEKGSNINVFVRVRPLTKDENTRGDKPCVQVLKDTQFIKVVDYGYGYNALTRKFQFDGCLSHEVKQKQVMEKCRVSRLLDSVLEGYSSAVIACGQTGSGKTFTMCGRNNEQERNTEDDGLIAQCVSYIFSAMKKFDDAGEKMSFCLKASYYEVYNEQVNDLLRLDCAPREVKWSLKDGYYVDNLLLVECESVDDVFSVLSEGAKNRKVGSHDLNKDSSRSHCIMTLYVDTVTDIGDGSPPIVRYGKMLFVDLAGSERLKKSRSSGEMLRETGNINRSLFTLGKVISALAEGKKGDLVPYRESMLTKLLMETLGGNSLALMIACVSPAASAVEETLSTLYYATCTKTIVNAPTINIDERDKALLDLKKEVDRLKAENKLLRSRLGLPLDGDINSMDIESIPVPIPQVKEDVTNTGLSLALSSLAKSIPSAPVDENNDSVLTEGILNSKCGWMLDKERMLTQLRTAERLLCKKMHTGSVQSSTNIPSSLWQDDCAEDPIIEGIENLPDSPNLLGNVQVNQSFSDTGSFKDKSVDYNCASRGRSDEEGCRQQRKMYSAGKQSSTYRGIDANRPRLLSRRNRVSVDHLSSRLRSKNLPRTSSGKGCNKDSGFQGSITVNQNAFLRLLDINVSDKEESTL